MSLSLSRGNNYSIPHISRFWTALQIGAGAPIQSRRGHHVRRSVFALRFFEGESERAVKAVEFFF